MPWLDGPGVKDKVKATLGIDAFDAGSTNWDVICAGAAEAAKADILVALGKRGFDAAQALAWDGLAAFNESQALYWALEKGGATKDYADRLIVTHDRRAELATVAVTIGGVRQSPSLSPVTSGESSTANDVFSLADRDLDAYRSRPWPSR